MKRYLNGIHDKFQHLATWLPDERLRLGDIGELRRGRFFLKTTLQRLKIKFTRRIGHAGVDWEHSSGEDVSVDLSATAESIALGSPSGHAVVTFGACGAFLFQATGCVTETIEDMANVGNEIVVAHRLNEFEKDWVVIDRLVTAASATILICDSSNARLELGAKTALETLPSLANASLGVHAKRWEGEVTRFVAHSQLTPMFGASRLHRGFFGGTRVDPVRGDDSGPENGGPLEDLTNACWVSEVTS